MIDFELRRVYICGVSIPIHEGPIRITAFAVLVLAVAGLAAQQPSVSPAQQSPIRQLLESAPPPPVPLLRVEMRLWHSMQTNDPESLRAMLLPDFAFVGDKILDREQMLASIELCKAGPVKFFTPQTRMTAPAVAVSTYRISQNLACGTLRRPGDVNASSIWVKRDGKWLLHLHTETPVANP